MSLVHVHGRVIVSIDLEGKNSHTFADGTKIRLERQFNELNRRITEPVNAIVTSGEGMPGGTEILVHPNAATDTHKIYNHEKLSGEKLDSNVQYYSIPEEMCFAYYDDGWKPLPGFDFALRIYEPYVGILDGIAPTRIKNTLFVTTGKYKDKAVLTVKAADYQIIFQDKNGQEGNLIRFRSEQIGDREVEAIAILDTTTKKVLSGKYIIGISEADAKPIKLAEVGV